MKPLPKDLQVVLGESRNIIHLMDENAHPLVSIDHTVLELPESEREAIGMVVSATITKLQENRERR